jgi:hypothetical protein
MCAKMLLKIIILHIQNKYLLYCIVPFLCLHVPLRDFIAFVVGISAEFTVIYSNIFTFLALPNNGKCSLTCQLKVSRDVKCVGTYLPHKLFTSLYTTGANLSSRIGLPICYVRANRHFQCLFNILYI